jgi:hypothetical protein
MVCARFSGALDGRHGIVSKGLNYTVFYTPACGLRRNKLPEVVSAMVKAAIGGAQRCLWRCGNFVALQQNKR